MGREVIKVFLDMDGVIADFLSGVSKAHNRPLPYDRPEAMGVWDTEVLWGITAKEFWAPVDNLSFWKGLDKTKEADALVDLLSFHYGEKNICILTAPSKSPWCVPGKRWWIEKHFPQFKDRMIFASAKEFLAGPNKILVDDRTQNLKHFEAAGGTGILVPRLWNHGWPHADKAMARVISRVDYLERLMK